MIHLIKSLAKGLISVGLGVSSSHYDDYFVSSKNW